MTTSETGSGVEQALMAVGPVDGRYLSRTRALARYLSEFALIRYRVMVEVEWYLEMAATPEIEAVPPLSEAAAAGLREIYRRFAVADAARVKELERTTNHDVKAVEYFLRERLAAMPAASDLRLEMIHFACTSEDINNLAYALSLRDLARDEVAPRLKEIVAQLSALALRHKALPMLALTHGQHASPTTFGKEIAVFAARLERQLGHLARQEFLGKFNGAVGNFNAHQVAYPDIDWIALSRRFVERLGLVWNPLTTQIESHDFIAELCDLMVRFDSILLDLARDLWGYVSLGHLSPRVIAGEVGSSTMPHKVNPIDFENCEGNVGIATSLFQHLATKLPVSRWQRDLSDSTAMRSLGTAFGHLLIAIGSMKRGLSLIEVNAARIAAEVEDARSYEVLAEAIQTVMRRHAVPDAYERLKELTRGRTITRADLEAFVEGLELDAHAKAALRNLTPARYIGLAAELVERFTPRSPVNKRVDKP